MRQLRPSVQPNCCSACTNAVLRACPSGSSAAVFMSTPNRGTSTHGHGSCRAIFSRAPAKGRLSSATGVRNWTLHDLRRTARSLLSRAGVASDHAERCLGHVIGGVRGIYDRHEYFEEKKAFEALAAQIDMIIHPRDNVVGIKRRGR